MFSTCSCADESGSRDSDFVEIGDVAELSPRLILDLGGNEEVVRRSTLSSESINLRLCEMVVEGTSVTGFRVFVNNKNAHIGSSIDDPSYLTSFSFFPMPTQDGKVGTFVVGLESTLHTILACDEVTRCKQLTLTIVPIGTDDSRIGFGSSEVLGKRNIDTTGN